MDSDKFNKDIHRLARHLREAVGHIAVGTHCECPPGDQCVPCEVSVDVVSALTAFEQLQVTQADVADQLAQVAEFVRAFTNDRKCQTCADIRSRCSFRDMSHG